jgi:hypothetical protein
LLAILILNPLLGIFSSMNVKLVLFRFFIPYCNTILESYVKILGCYELQSFHTHIPHIPHSMYLLGHHELGDDC